jgi:hypothetical protein
VFTFFIEYKLIYNHIIILTFQDRDQSNMSHTDTYTCGNDSKLLLNASISSISKKKIDVIPLTRIYLDSKDGDMKSYSPSSIDKMNTMTSRGQAYHNEYFLPSIIKNVIMRMTPVDKLSILYCVCV